MENLTPLFSSVVSELNAKLQEEVDVLESIFSVTEDKEKEVKEKLFLFVNSKTTTNRLRMITKCFEKAVCTRPKQRRSLMTIFKAFYEKFHPKIDEIKPNNTFSNLILMYNIPERNSNYRNYLNFPSSNEFGSAIFNDNVEKLREILAISNENEKKSIDVSNYSHCCNSALPLSVAALFGSVKCFKFLVANGNKIGSKTCSLAIAGGNPEIVHICEQSGKKFSDVSFFNSIRYHRFELFEWLVTHYGNEDNYSYGCLQFFNEPAFFYYISRGIDLDEVFEKEKTVLHYAVKFMDEDLIEFILENKINIDSKDINKKTPICYALKHELSDIIKLLINKGASVKNTDKKKKRTALHIAAKLNDVDFIDLLISKQADVNACDVHNETPLHFAVRNSNLEAADLLIKNGADISAQDIYKFTPLHYAVGKDRIDIIELLINKGSDINALTLFGKTPLQCAILNDKLENVQFLISHGADINMPDFDGITPLKTAEKCKNKEIYWFIQRTINGIVLS